LHGAMVPLRRIDTSIRRLRMAAHAAVTGIANGRDNTD
jgi:hypothetical protein